MNTIHPAIYESLLKQCLALPSGARKELVRELHTSLHPGNEDNPTKMLKDITDTISERCGIDVRQKNQQNTYVLLRGLFIYIARKKTVLTFSEIAAWVNLKHPAAVTAFKRTSEILENPKVFFKENLLFEPVLDRYGLSPVPADTGR